MTSGRCPRASPMCKQFHLQPTDLFMLDKQDAVLNSCEGTARKSIRLRRFRCPSSPPIRERLHPADRQAGHQMRSSFHIRIPRTPTRISDLPSCFIRPGSRHGTKGIANSRGHRIPAAEVKTVLKAVPEDGARNCHENRRRPRRTDKAGK